MTAGTIQQGGLTTISIKNNDLEHPFDSTCALSLPGTCCAYANTTLAVSNGIVSIGSVTDNLITASIFANVDATKETSRW